MSKQGVVGLVIFLFLLQFVCSQNAGKALTCSSGMLAGQARQPHNNNFYNCFMLYSMNILTAAPVPSCPLSK